MEPANSTVESGTFLKLLRILHFLINSQLQAHQVIVSRVERRNEMRHDGDGNEENGGVRDRGPKFCPNSFLELEAPHCCRLLFNARQVLI